ncbi:hypothetical protein [Aliivibrio fischeri]|uniref:hypothetical protein n=1 Tax=Aliivibrio fischeri TaxID=668 RepID=UPI0012D85503|nr:hypothetical protein [Aliivibrio fischeri]MUJ20427.1 hypothetical protein [Aliivibrio fischeri]
MKQQFITANVTLELKVHSETIATISKVIDLPNVYEIAEAIPTDLILMDKVVVTSDLIISKVDSDTGIVQLRPGLFDKISVKELLDNTNIQSLKSFIEQAGWSVELLPEGLKSLEDRAKKQEELDSTRDDRLSDCEYVKKHKLNLTRAQWVISRTLTLCITLAMLILLKSNYGILDQQWSWGGLAAWILLAALVAFGRDKVVDKYMVHSHKKMQIQSSK